VRSLPPRQSTTCPASSRHQAAVCPRVPQRPVRALERRGARRPQPPIPLGVEATRAWMAARRAAFAVDEARWRRCRNPCDVPPAPWCRSAPLEASALFLTRPSWRPLARFLSRELRMTCGVAPLLDRTLDVRGTGHFARGTQLQRRPGPERSLERSAPPVPRSGGLRTGSLTPEARRQSPPSCSDELCFSPIHGNRTRPADLTNCCPPLCTPELCNGTDPLNLRSTPHVGRAHRPSRKACNYVLHAPQATPIADLFHDDPSGVIAVRPSPTPSVSARYLWRETLPSW